MHLLVFTIFCFLVDEKIKLNVLACSFEITYGTNFENLFSNPASKTLKRRFLTLKCLQEAACDSVNHMVLEAACAKLILAHFPAANERSSLENIDKSQRRKL
jgi:hypothetical protein